MSTDGRRDGRTHYYSPLRLTSGDNKDSKINNCNLLLYAHYPSRSHKFLLKINNNNHFIVYHMGKILRPGPMNAAMLVYVSRHMNKKSCRKYTLLQNITDLLSFERMPVHQNQRI